MSSSSRKAFVRTSTKLLKPREKLVLPGHLTGEYVTANAHDLFGILPEPEENSIPPDTSSYNSKLKRC